MELNSRSWYNSIGFPSASFISRYMFLLIMHILQLMKLRWYYAQQHPSMQHSLSPEQFRSEMVMEQKLFNNAFLQGMSQNAVWWRLPRTSDKPLLLFHKENKVTKCCPYAWGNKFNVVHASYLHNIPYFSETVFSPFVTHAFVSHHLNLSRWSWTYSSLLLPFFFSITLFHLAFIPEHCSF